MSQEPSRIPNYEEEGESVDRLGRTLRAGDTVQHFEPIFGDLRGVGTVVGFHDGQVMVEDHRHQRIYSYAPGNVERSGE